MNSLEKRLLPILAVLVLGLGFYFVVRLSAEAQEEAPVKELKDFNASEQIGVDVDVPFPTDI